MEYSSVDSEISSTIRLIAKPDMEFPNMETTLLSVMMVKSRVQSGKDFCVSDIIPPNKKSICMHAADKCDHEQTNDQTDTDRDRAPAGRDQMDRHLILCMQNKKGRKAPWFNLSNYLQHLSMTYSDHVPGFAVGILSFICWGDCRSGNRTYYNIYGVAMSTSHFMA